MIITIPEYSVSELVNTIKTLLEGAFYYIKLKGEISSFKIATSGHMYFNLKDENSMINVVLFKNSQNDKIVLQDGLNVLVYGKITIYKDRSTYQLIAEKVDIYDEGILYKIIEERKNKLDKEGLFKQKRAIPKNIKRLGIITAENGAAIKDIEVRLKDRLIPNDIFLYPSLVQGQDADKSIIKGIKFFNEKCKVDLIVITRGGGSVEDLMCFNSEELARAVFASNIPTISAVGHEIDWTIIDYVADLRLPTPTSAAETLFPLKSILNEKLDYLYKRIILKTIRIYNVLINKVILKFNDIFIILFRNYNNKLHKINLLNEKIKSFDKTKILKMGYSIVMKNGKKLSNRSKIKQDDILEIEVYKKKFKVIVKEVIKN